MRVSDRVATHQRRCHLDRCGVTTCDRSRSRGCVRRATPKFRLAGTADLRVSTFFAILRRSFSGVVISGGQRRNEDSTGVVIEDIDCSRLTTPWLFDSEYIVWRARHSPVLFTRVFCRRGASRTYKAQRVRSRCKTDSERMSRSRVQILKNDALTKADASA
ncbi:uncharacterized protein LOC112451716 [Temnothorax curvispinosus]|uniref:Uncharacterized protein LOC112451716 n=1 Tax=Temnothorax curvispinosus TaxID=300111 RepID=A0A6J1PD27_9HYME|nr:uncharacterized protein LOC112451716 [Temnothorax curvispinosus]